MMAKHLGVWGQPELQSETLSQNQKLQQKSKKHLLHVVLSSLLFTVVYNLMALGAQILDQLSRTHVESSRGGSPRRNSEDTEL